MRRKPHVLQTTGSGEWSQAVKVEVEHGFNGSTSLLQRRPVRQMAESRAKPLSVYPLKHLNVGLRDGPLAEQ